MLQDDGAPVITRVNPQRHARYGYGDSVRYNYYSDYADAEISARV